jgi:hypothetical protein
MHTGMMWFSNNPKMTLQEKIVQGVAYYTKKYGRQPDMVLVHPSMMEQQEKPDITGVTVRPYRPVLPGHIWIGVEDKPSAEANKALGDD